MRVPHLLGSFSRFGALLIAASVACTPATKVAPASSPASHPAADAAVTATAAASGPEILWDVWGVPHIYGDSPADVAYGFGWAQMRAHGELLLKLYARARGRAAEYWGEDEVDSDRQMRTFGVPRRAEGWLAAQSPAARQVLTSFVAGMNAYANAHRDDWSKPAKRVLPVVDTDPLAHLQAAIHFTFMTFAARGAVRGWSDAGSNAYAIAPARSGSGRPLLLVNPHLPWFGAFLFFEAHLISPASNMYGAGLIGMPMLSLGFNQHLGWTHTVNTYDGADLYELEVDERYFRLDGVPTPLELRTEQLKVRRPDGTFETRKIEIRSSTHGPIVAEKDGKALALRIAGLDRPHLLEQSMAMAAATDLPSFKRAMAKLQLPMFNTIYADRHGDIYYLFNGIVPRRPRGDVKFWRGIVDGTKSELIWSEYLPFDALPQYTNPDSGFLHNANDPPWTSTYPAALDPKDFPAYLAPQFMTPRARHAAEQILADESVTFAELIALQQSNRLEAADEGLDELIALAKKARDPEIRAAGKVLEAWDRQTDADSRGGVLFAEWAREAEKTEGRQGLYKKTWSPTTPLTPPSGFVKPKAAVAALRAAAKRVKDKYGALDVPWGQVYRIQHAGRDLPASVGPSGLGAFRVGGFARQKDGRYAINRGNTIVLTVELGDRPRAKGILTYGNTTDAESPFYGNQLELFSKGQLRDVLFERSAVKANLAQREALTR